MNASLQLGEFLPYRISRLAERISGSLADVYSQPFQLSIAQWRVLATLQEKPGITAQDDCRRDKPGQGKGVAGSEWPGTAGLRRAPTGPKRRQGFGAAADSGRGSALSRDRASGAELERQLLSVLGSDEQQRLYGLLHKLEEGLAVLDASSKTVPPE